MTNEPDDRKPKPKPQRTLDDVRSVLDSDALTCDAEVVAAGLGMTTWAWYEAVKRGDAPIKPIRVGRRQKYRISDVRVLLGLDPTVSAPVRT